MGSLIRLTFRLLDLCFNCAFVDCRAPDDWYDRFWFPEGPTSTIYLTPTTSSKSFLSTTSTFTSLLDQAINQPSAVMQTAVTSNGTITSFLLPPDWQIETSLYVSVYYGELIKSVTPTPRNFTIAMPSSTATVSLDGTFLDSGGWDFWPSGITAGPNSTMTMTPLATSLAGPILNCMEVFAVSDPRASKTLDRDGELFQLFIICPD